LVLGEKDDSGYTRSVPVDPKMLPQDAETLKKMLVDVTAQLDRTERLLRQLLAAKTGRKRSSFHANSWRFSLPKRDWRCRSQKNATTPLTKIHQRALREQAAEDRVVASRCRGI
jgi:hypothetical protein